MSLINQMLRDLEQRKDAGDRRVAASTPMAAPPQSRQRPWWPWLAIALFCSLVFAWQSRQSAPATTSPALAPQTAPPATSGIDMPTAPPAPPSPVSVDITPTARIVIVTSPLPSGPPTTLPPTTPKPAVASKAKPVTSSKPPLTAKADARRSSHPDKIQNLLQQAQGDMSLLMRKETLKEALVLAPHNLNIREQLLKTLLKTGNTAELESFLRECLILFPNHPVFLSSQAQLQLQRKDYAAASATLERIDSSDPGYLRLLAGSYQQQKRHHDAAELYQRLTQLQPEKAENWLGLAISAESLQQRQMARQAYRQALDKNTLNDEVVDYIRQRLSVLE